MGLWMGPFRSSFIYTLIELSFDILLIIEGEKQKEPDTILWWLKF